MSTWSETRQRLLAAAGAARAIGRRQVAEHYGDPLAEYHAIDAAGGICDRADRAVLRITGRDRATWLHNLTTNQVKTLTPGQWRYAFALNVKGRILFDLNLLVDEDCIWLDLDDRFVPTALAHFSKYTIVEDVKLEDVSEGFARITVLGANGVNAWSLLMEASPEFSRDPKGSALPEKGAAPDWNWTRCALEGAAILAWHDPSHGVESADLIVPIELAASLWTRLAASPSLLPVGWTALQTRRIEAGLPASVSELNEDVLPAETGQLERAVSFNKGCYLGQEVVERMRAHKSVARKLVGLVFKELETRNSKLETGGLSLPAPITLDDKPAGTLTSLCYAPKLNRMIGLGYLRLAQSAPGTSVRTVNLEACVAFREKHGTGS